MGALTFTGARGATLAYTVRGAQDAPRTLICHPGGPGMSSGTLGELGGVAGGELRLVLFDPRGAGASSRPVDGRYELAEYVADLEALRSELGLERIDLLGHSHGGFVSLLYAATHPDRLRRLVLVCTAPRFSPELREEAQAAFARHSDEPWYEDALAAGAARQAGAYASADELAALYAREVRLWFGQWDERSRAFAERHLAGERPDIDALRWFNGFVAPGYDVRPLLSQIRAPTLVINGDADWLGPRVSARELAAIPDVRIVMVPGAGHWVFAEQPERFRAEVETFLG